MPAERALRLVRLKKKSIFLTLPELLRADSSESQGLLIGIAGLFRDVVSRRHKSSKWKQRQYRKDMGDVDWHVPIDAERSLAVVRLKKNDITKKYFFLISPISVPAERALRFVRFFFFFLFFSCFAC